MRILIFVAVLLTPAFAQSQPPAEPKTEPPKVDAPATSQPDVIKVDGDKVTIGEVVTNVSEVVTAVQDYKTTKSQKGWSLALMAILAAVFKLVLSAVKLTSDFWKGRKGKTILRLITVGLGVAAFFTSNLAGGMGWMDALVVGMAGPIAVAIHEYSILIPQLANKKDARSKKKT